MKKKLKIGTIEQELKKCRAAFAEYTDATWAWCLHHEVHCEQLTEPPENRITFILKSKFKSEQAIRLRNFRPCKNAAAVKPARDAYAAAVKPASDACDAAVKPARDAYAAAVKTASDAYDAYDDAVKPARDAYAAAVKTARDAYDAYDAAVKTAKDALRKMHKSEWPNNTWNGKSIFNQ